MKKLLLFLTLTFLFLFIVKSFIHMSAIPLHDFDEANRAEGARNMKEYHQYIAPLTGSPFHKYYNLGFFISEANKTIYYHLERPPFVFWTMIASTKIFGENEFGFRFPSFIFGLLTVLLLFSFAYKKLTKNIFVIIFGMLSILVSFDWWISSQSALMDTTLSFFLTAGLISLLVFLRSKKNLWLVLAGLGWGFAFLSKGQPAVIFLFPLIFLFFYKKLSIKNLVVVILSFSIIAVPWILFAIHRFGLRTFIETFVLFARSRALSPDKTQQAPFFWYYRWWIESFRVGVTMFSSLLIYDFVKKSFSLEKLTILSYIIFSFLLFSFSKNKVWWYVLPLIPAVSIYILYSVNDIIKRDKRMIGNIGIIATLSFIPVFYHTSNKVALAYGMFLLLASLLILHLKTVSLKKAEIFAVSGIFFVFFVFSANFPQVSPTYTEMPIMGNYYQTLSKPKCLYVSDMPYESALFYTQAKEIEYLRNFKKEKKCASYLLTPKKKDKYKLIKEIGRLRLYKVKN